MRYSANGQLLVQSAARQVLAKLMVALCIFSFASVAYSDDADEKKPALTETKNPRQAKAPERLGGPSIFGEQERLPAVADGEMTLPSIMAATTSVEKIGNGSTPKKFRSEEETPEGDLPESGMNRDSQWSPTTYQFAAANTFSHPRYFEDRMLERHGYERCPTLQPLISGAKFFATFPALPYLMTVNPPGQIQSQLGYFRPGTAIYPYIERPPYQRDAVINEAAVVAGGIIAIP